MSQIVFDAPAGSWNEALPIGNGVMGAMVFGGTVLERIQLNEDSLWSGGPMDRVNPDALAHLNEVRELLFSGNVAEAEKLASRSMFATYPHMRHYQTLGDIWLDFTDEHAAKHLVDVGDGMSYVAPEMPTKSAYRRTLDLATSIGSIDVSYHEGFSESRSFFASAPDNVLVYRIERSGKALSFDLSVTRKDNRHGKGSSYCDGVAAEHGDTVRLWGVQGGSNGIGFELAVRVVPEGGAVRSMGSRLIVSDASAATIVITARTTYRSQDPRLWCANTLAEAAEKGYAELHRSAIADYRRLFDACTLSLPIDEGAQNCTTQQRLKAVRSGAVDTGLVAMYFDFSRYLFISSSREGSLPANLQGIWNEDFEPAWGSKYTININTEMNYWMAEKVGLSELHMPLLEHLKRMVPRGRDVARRMYGLDGFCCHHNTDIWCDCAPQDEHTSATIWPMGAAWLCLHLIEHYRYTRDANFLVEYLPVLRESVRFFVGYLVRDSRGRWVTGPSASPENCYEVPGGVANLCMGPTMDTELVRELFEGYQELSADAAEPESPELLHAAAERLEGLPSLTVGKYGQIQEWSEDYGEPEPGHRHISQLFALYPASQIRPDLTPELARAAVVTLERRLKFGGGHTGWSKAWITLLWDRLGDAEKAWENLNGLFSNSTLPNLFDNHPPFQIDGNFGGGAAILEMLVRDYGDSVWLLPALPKELSNGSISGVRLMSGAVLDMTWRGGKLAEASLTARRDGTTKVRLPHGEEVQIELKQGEKRMLSL